MPARILAAIVCLLAWASLVCPATSGAATWNSLQLPGEAANVRLFGMSCPSASLCVAVGANNTIASSVDPTGGTSQWSVVHPGVGSEPTAVNYRQIRGVSCPSAQLCVAVAFEGLVYTSTNPTGAGSSWEVTDLSAEGPNVHLYGVSCPTSDFCTASAAGAKVLTTTNPTGGAASWNETQLPGPLELRGVSCASAALCVAVGDDGDNLRPELGDQGVILSSTDALGGNWTRAEAPIKGNAYGVSCPAPSLCVSGDLGGNLLVSTAPGSPSSWTSIDGGGSVQITDVDCPTTSLCAAVDNNGDVLTSTDPTAGPGAWTFTNLSPFPGVDETSANAIFGVSCAAASLCALAGSEGRIYTSADPFSARAASPGPAEPRHPQKHKPRPKRPRVHVSGGPWPQVVLRGRRLTVPFRFYVRHAQVRGFVCRIDNRPLRRCRSPKHYRVGVGRHIFRVRAIGWSGLRGPAARWSFEVCHPTPYPACHKPKTYPVPGSSTAFQDQIGLSGADADWLRNPPQ
jgi:hypothetical protein